jgi:hypothetical protein
VRRRPRRGARRRRPTPSSPRPHRAGRWSATRRTRRPRASRSRSPVRSSRSSRAPSGPTPRTARPHPKDPKEPVPDVRQEDVAASTPQRSSTETGVATVKDLKEQVPAIRQEDISGPAALEHRDGAGGAEAEGPRRRGPEARRLLTEPGPWQHPGEGGGADHQACGEADDQDGDPQAVLPRRTRRTDPWLSPPPSSSKARRSLGSGNDQYAYGTITVTGTYVTGGFAVDLPAGNADMSNIRYLLPVRLRPAARVGRAEPEAARQGVGDRRRDRRGFGDHERHRHRRHVGRLPVLRVGQ